MTSILTLAPNAAVEYIDEAGAVVATDHFYDPGLDPESWYAREQKARGVWRGPHLAYGCGRKLGVALSAAVIAIGLAACSAIPAEKIASACDTFRRAEANPKVQLALAGGTIAGNIMTGGAVGPVVA